MNNLKLTPSFDNVILFALLTGSGLNIFVWLFDFYLFNLEADQLLYLYSTMAQVIGGMFGFTLAAYVFFVDKFKDSARNDDTYYDAINSLLQKYHRALIIIASICGVAISFSVLGIVNLNGLNLLLNEAAFIFILGLVSTLIFGIKLLDPRKLDKESVKLRKNAETYYETNKDEFSSNIREFILAYNNLENLINMFANELDNTKYTFDKEFKGVKNLQPKIMDSLKKLSLSEIINRKLYNDINEIRVYRNSLIHGTDLRVSKKVYNRLLTIYRALENVYEQYKNDLKGSQSWNDALENLYKI